MHDGSLKAAHEVFKGDLIASRNGQPNEVMSVVVGEEKEPMFTIRSGQHSLTVSSKHIFVRQSGEMAQTTALKVGEQVLGESGAPIRIDEIQQLPLATGQRVVNFELKTSTEGAIENSLIAAHGFLSGDIALQVAHDKK